MNEGIRFLLDIVALCVLCTAPFWVLAFLIMGRSMLVSLWVLLTPPRKRKGKEKRS